MERGALSDKKFKSFADKVIPYLHVTTRIPNRSNDRMLSDMGGTGFPTLMFLDSEGKKLLQYRGPRTTNGFEQSYEQLGDYVDLLRRYKKGDKKAAAPLLIRQLELEIVDFEKATKLYAEAEPSEKEKKVIDRLMIDCEVRSLVDASQRDRKKQIQTGQRFIEMWKQGKTPSGESQTFQFWAFICNLAEVEGDRKLFKSALDELKKTSVGKDSRYSRALRSMEKTLKDL